MGFSPLRIYQDYFDERQSEGSGRSKDLMNSVDFGEWRNFIIGKKGVLLMVMVVNET